MAYPEEVVAHRENDACLAVISVTLIIIAILLIGFFSWWLNARHAINVGIQQPAPITTPTQPGPAGAGGRGCRIIRHSRNHQMKSDAGCLS